MRNGAEETKKLTLFFHMTRGQTGELSTVPGDGEVLSLRKGGERKGGVHPHLSQRDEKRWVFYTKKAKVSRS